MPNAGLMPITTSSFALTRLGRAKVAIADVARLVLLVQRLGAQHLLLIEHVANAVELRRRSSETR